MKIYFYSAVGIDKTTKMIAVRKCGTFQSSAHVDDIIREICKILEDENPSTSALLTAFNEV